MTIVFKTVSAAVLAAALAMPAVAQDVPLNTTFSGGAGQATVDGQNTLLGGGLAGGVGMGIALATFLVVVTSDDTVVTSTP